MPDKLNDCFFSLALLFPYSGNLLAGFNLIASTSRRLKRGSHRAGNPETQSGVGLAINMPSFFPVFATEKHCSPRRIQV
jgi:hypothetical protein